MVMEDILPACVMVEESSCDLDVELAVEEASIVARSVDKRRREFTSGRACAHRALARLGLPNRPVLAGSRGEPIWPPGVVGSITHCDGYRACAVALSADMVGVGIDAEPNRPLPDGVLDYIGLPEEVAGLEPLLAQVPDIRWDRLLFSAKESTYKFCYPLSKKLLGFKDARFVFDRYASTFSIQLLVPGPLISGLRLSVLKGRWKVWDEMIYTAITYPAASSDPGDGHLGGNDSSSY